MTAFVETWPHPHHPVTDGEPDVPVTVEVFQLRPDLVAEFLGWSGGEELFVNGGPAVLLPGSRRAADRIVGLGDYAVQDQMGRFTAEPAAGWANRYIPAVG